MSCRMSLIRIPQSREALAQAGFLRIAILRSLWR
jgi:hypothetical protein